MGLFVAFRFVPLVVERLLVLGVERRLVLRELLFARALFLALLLLDEVAESRLRVCRASGSILLMRLGRIFSMALAMMVSNWSASADTALFTASSTMVAIVVSRSTGSEGVSVGGKHVFAQLACELDACEVAAWMADGRWAAVLA